MNSILIDLLGCEVQYRGSAYRTRTIEYGSGPPLVLLHGVGGHAEAFSRNLKRLGSAHHVIAADLLWHGLSNTAAFTPEMVPEYCKQLIDLMDAIGAPRVSIEGESLGGHVAMYFALHYPDRVERIVLNTPSGVKYDEAEVKIDAVAGANALRDRSLEALRNPNRETLRKRLEWLMARSDQVTDELIDLRYALYTNPQTRESLTNVFQNSFKGGTSPYMIREGDLAKIPVETLVLWTDKNPGTGPDAGERLARLIPGARYHCINDAAHWPQWEQPEEHDQVVNTFLAGGMPR